MTFRVTRPGSSRIADAMSVNGPRKAMKRGSVSLASWLSEMISCAPGESTGVLSSGIWWGAPLATVTLPSRSINLSSRSISSRDSSML